MARAATFGVLFVLVSVALVAQTPAIRLHGVVNAASYAATGLPNGSIAQGSLFTIFGANLGPAQPASASSFPLGSTLAGVSISVTQGTTTVAALPLYVRPDQINA